MGIGGEMYVRMRSAGIVFALVLAERECGTYGFWAELLLARAALVCYDDLLAAR